MNHTFKYYTFIKPLLLLLSEVENYTNENINVVRICETMKAIYVTRFVNNF